MLKNLLSDGANPNEKNSFNKTPLYYAVLLSKPSIVSLLLDAGADVFDSDNENSNILKLAYSKALVCKSQDQSSELETFQSEALEVYEKLKNHVLKLENGIQLLSNNCIMTHSQLETLSTDKDKILQNNLKSDFKRHHPIHYNFDFHHDKAKNDLDESGIHHESQLQTEEKSIGEKSMGKTKLHKASIR